LEKERLKSVENQGADTNGSCVVSKDSPERVYLILAVYSNEEIEGIELVHYRWMKIVAATKAKLATYF
jgi:hypothetical protein